MNVYFVRHGETEFNVKELTQHAGVHLSDRGFKQAHIVAERLIHLPIQHIVASPYIRAKQTVEVIHVKMPHIPLVFSDLFREQKQPTTIEGIHVSDPHVKEVFETQKKHIHLPDYRFQDEETFTELKIRAKQALEYLVSLNIQEVLVVTHGNFLRILFMYILFKEELTYREARAVRKTLYAKNTGITFCRYERTEERWHVITWNDLAHLAE